MSKINKGVAKMQGSIEGMWAVWFQGVVGMGSGIVVLETGKVFGGDSSWHYRGDYTIQDDRFSANVEVTHYGAPGNAVTGHSAENSPFQLTITGDRVDSATIEAQGRSTTGAMAFELRKVAELP